MKFQCKTAQQKWSLLNSKCWFMRHFTGNNQFFDGFNLHGFQRKMSPDGMTCPPQDLPERAPCVFRNTRERFLCPGSERKTEQEELAVFQLEFVGVFWSIQLPLIPFWRFSHFVAKLTTPGLLAVDVCRKCRVLLGPPTMKPITKPWRKFRY